MLLEVTTGSLTNKKIAGYTFKNVPRNIYLCACHLNLMTGDV